MTPVTLPLPLPLAANQNAAHPFVEFAPPFSAARKYDVDLKWRPHTRFSYTCDFSLNGYLYTLVVSSKTYQDLVEADADYRLWLEQQMIDELLHGLSS